MKSLKLLVIPFVLAILFAGCSWDGNSTSVLSDEEAAELVQELHLDVTSTRGVDDPINVEVDWTNYRNMSNVTYNLTRSSYSTNGTVVDDLIVSKGVETSYIDTIPDGGTNTLFIYTVSAYVNGEKVSENMVSFVLFPNEGDVRVTMLEVEAYNTCDLYNSTGVDYEDHSASTMTSANLIIEDTKDNNSWSSEGTGTTVTTYTPFTLSVFVHVDDYAAEKYGVSTDGYYQISNSDNCRIELADDSLKGSDAFMAWTYSFEDLPLTNTSCDEDFDDVVVLVELLGTSN